MVGRGVIKPQDHHTDWCSSITCSVKKDGSLRLCLDPRKLNNALKRCPQKIPTIEEITAEFTQAKFFTKLDAKCGYWSVQLHAPSQDLTTFRTPFGRYCFPRLPFGLSVSQDSFQRHMDRITSQCTVCVGISDDIIVFDTTEEEHDSNLINFLQVARREGLKLNSAKWTIKSRQVHFLV